MVYNARGKRLKDSLRNYSTKRLIPRVHPGHYLSICTGGATSAGRAALDIVGPLNIVLLRMYRVEWHCILCGTYLPGL
jgi:hypothetical protein